MFRIFNKDVISKELFTVNLSQQEVDVVLEGDLFKDHPELSPKACIVVEQDYPFNYPTFDREKNTIREMSLYERYKNSLYELQFNEVEFKNDILTLEAGQYIKDNELVTVPKIEGVKVEWDWVNHIWEDKATNLEVVEAQYKEYEVMNDPLTLKEMEMQDPNLLTEYYNMMLELRKLIYALKKSETQPVGYTAIQLPTPSKALKEFKNKFDLIK